MDSWYASLKKRWKSPRRGGWGLSSRAEAMLWGGAGASAQSRLHSWSFASGLASLFAAGGVSVADLV